MTVYFDGTLICSSLFLIELHILYEYAQSKGGCTGSNILVYSYYTYT